MALLRGSLTEVFALGLVAVAGLAGAYLLLRNRRRRLGWNERWARRSALLDVLLVAWLVAMLSVTLVPTTGPGSPALDLVPFVDSWPFSSEDRADSAINLVGNLALFCPLGFLGAARWPALARPPWRAALFACVLSVAVEAAQYAVVVSRETSVDDVILNLAGALLGARLARALARTPGRHSVATRPGARARAG